MEKINPVSKIDTSNSVALHHQHPEYKNTHEKKKSDKDDFADYLNGEIDKE